MNVLVRPAAELDLAAIQTIYAHHVLHGSGTFEEEPPSVSEMKRRIADVQTRGLPWLIAEIEGAVVGYAYAGPFRLRSAYRFTAETSVYVAPGHLGQGIGRALLSRLLAACSSAGVQQMIAMIGDSDNQGSIALHRSFGFKDVGTFKNVGLKAGRWLDVVALQLELAPDASVD